MTDALLLRFAPGERSVNWLDEPECKVGRQQIIERHIVQVAIRTCKCVDDSRFVDGNRRIQRLLLDGIVAGECGDECECKHDHSRSARTPTLLASRRNSRRKCARRDGHPPRRHRMAWWQGMHHMLTPQRAGNAAAHIKRTYL